MQVWMLAWELLGAAVGAGMASGREIASFFARYGAWGYGGIAAAGAVILLLTGTGMPVAWSGRWPEKLWQTLNALLLLATGGAMLAGAGEMAAAWQSGGGRWWGMAVTLASSYLLAKKTAAGLAWISGILTAGLCVFLLWALMLPPMRAVSVEEVQLSGVLLRGVTYGGFNAALMHPLWAGSRAPVTARKKALRAAALMMGGLLAFGTATILRHPAMLSEPMPFLRLAKETGSVGQSLAAVCLYLAILSTLVACFRALGGKLWTAAGIFLVATMGFSGVVDAAYPVLGAACMVMMMWMKLDALRQSKKNKKFFRKNEKRC